MPIALQDLILLYAWERQAEQEGAEVVETVKLVPLLE